MSDRDRLAADLKEALKADLATGGGNRWPNEMFLATFLHALGWTRCGCEGCGDSITGDAWHYGCAATDIDEERLARALDGINMADWWEEYPVVEGGIIVAHETDINVTKAAASIAKAYREDNNERP